MDGARDQFLASAGCASDEHCYVGGTNPVHLVYKPRHGRTGMNETGHDALIGEHTHVLAAAICPRAFAKCAEVYSHFGNPQQRVERPRAGKQR